MKPKKLKPDYSKLISNAVTYSVVEDSDLEEFIKFHTGIRYEIRRGEEYGEGNRYVINLGKTPLDKYELKDYENFLAGKASSFMMEIIMRKLCIDGKLEPDTYMINIC